MCSFKELESGKVNAEKRFPDVESSGMTCFSLFTQTTAGHYQVYTVSVYCTGQEPRRRPSPPTFLNEHCLSPPRPAILSGAIHRLSDEEIFTYFNYVQHMTCMWASDLHQLEWQPGGIFRLRGIHAWHSTSTHGKIDKADPRTPLPSHSPSSEQHNLIENVEPTEGY